MASSSSADLTPAPAPAHSRRRALIVAAGVGALVAAAAVVALLVPRSGGHAAQSPRFRSADKAFSVVLPDGWRAVRGTELRAVRSAPAALLRRTDGSGMVVIHERPALARSSRSPTRDPTAPLARRFRGLQPVTARTVALPGGPAYVYTFARAAAGRVQSIAVAPRAGRTYTLDAVAGSGARDVAAQVGAILRSFDTTNPASRS